MDDLPFVVDVYKRDLTIENYFIGYLQHPYVSLYTGRGCRSKCTFCLWPQTLGGHRYRVRSAGQRGGGNGAGQETISRRCANSSSTTIRSPTICRAPKKSRGAWASWG